MDEKAKRPRRKHVGPRFKRETKTDKYTLADLVSSAVNDLMELGNELREWYDNLPDGLQEGRSDIDEAASELENISEPDVPEKLAGLEVEHSYVTRPSRQQGRSWRQGDATEMLDTAIQFLEGLEDNDEAEELARELNEIKDNADGVSMPGMYG
jgi:seryl-tRNA synthetase